MASIHNERIAYACTIIVLIGAGCFWGVTQCSDKEKARKEMGNAYKIARELAVEKKSLVDSLALVKKDLDSCESAKTPCDTTPCNKKPKVSKPVKTPAKSDVKVIRDTVTIEKPAAISGGNNTKITANDNQKNIVVQNEEGGKGSMTEINADNNRGNIIVNNGNGNVTIEKNPETDMKIAYLEFRVDSLGNEVTSIRDCKGKEVDSVINAVATGVYRKVTKIKIEAQKSRKR